MEAEANTQIKNLVFELKFNSDTLDLLPALCSLLTMTKEQFSVQPDCVKKGSSKIISFFEMSLFLKRMEFNLVLPKDRLFAESVNEIETRIKNEDSISMIKKLKEEITVMLMLQFFGEKELTCDHCEHSENENNGNPST